MKALLSLFFVLAAYFAQAQTAFHRHEIVGGKGVLTSDAQVGYRYHFTERWAARATLYASAGGFYTKSGHVSYSTIIPKIGVQWKTSSQPFHALLMADLAVPFMSKEISTGSYSYNPLISHSYQSNIKGSGVGLSIGVGAEWLIKKRVALILFTQPTFCSIWEQGTHTNDGVESFYTQQYITTYGDILGFSVSYRFL